MEEGPANSPKMRVAIIGGGPAGLTTLKHLKWAHERFSIRPFHVELFERDDEVGGLFKAVYEGAELVSSKYLTAFSDYRMPDDVPDFVTPEYYVEYLGSYCDEFHLWDSINCRSEVTYVSRRDDGKHELTVQNPLTGYNALKVFDAIVICNGLNNEPNPARIPGMYETSQCDILHSSEVKNSQAFFRLERSDPIVVILGAGETGMDMAHMAVTTPGVGQVILCHQDGFFCAPKRCPNPVVLGFWGKNSQDTKPLDTCVASLFDTAYVHPDLQKGNALWKYYDWSVKFLLKLATGTRGSDQWVGAIKEDRFKLDGIFFCKNDKAMPYISAPYRDKSWLNRIRTAIANVPVPETNGRVIEMAPWPSCFDTNGYLHFSFTGRPESDRIQQLGLGMMKPNVLIHATGYKRNFALFRRNEGTPYPTPDDALLVRGIYSVNDPSVAYIGFKRPSIGAIPPLAELQAQLWVLRYIESFAPDAVPAREKSAVPGYEIDYKLRPRAGRNMARERHGVDHESYAYQLALDIGSAPRFSFVLGRGFKVLYTWAMGGNYNTKFLMLGPWAKREVAEEVMRTELYRITARWTGLNFFFLYTLFPMILFFVWTLLLHVRDGFRSVWGGIKAACVKVTHSCAQLLPRRRNEDPEQNLPGDEQ